MLRRHRYYKPKRLAARNAPRRERASAPRSPRTGQAKKIVGLIFFLASFGWFGYFFLASDSFAVKTVVISGNRTIPTSEILSVIRGELARKHFWFVPGNNILLLDKRGIVRAIQNQYIVDQIVVRRTLPFKLHVALSEKLSRVVLRVRTPVEIIPAPEVSEEGGEAAEQTNVSHNNVTENKEAQEREVQYAESYFLLDVNGIAVASGPVSEYDLSELPVIEIIRDSQSGIQPGASVLNRESVELIFELYERVKASPQALAISHISLDLENSRELAFTTTEGWQALVSTEIPLETQLAKLELALTEKIKENRPSLQYIDLRVKDRVYFK